MTSPARTRHDLAAIVDVAVRTFLERGYDGTSMEHVARAAGLRKATLYHHVSGKEELLRLGVSRALDAYEAMLEEPGAAAGVDAVARLRYVLRRTCVLVTAFVPETALLIRARGNTDTERWAMEHRRRLNDALAQLIDDAAAAHAARSGGSGRGPDSQVLARLVLGMITSTVDWFRPGHAIEAAQLASTVETIVFDGAFAR